MKDGDYKIIFKNGNEVIAIHIFRHKDYKMYTISPVDMEVIFWEDYKRVSDTLVNYKLKEESQLFMEES